MLNKLSFNLMQELNESETNEFKIKKRVIMESSGVRTENLEEAHTKNENRRTIWSSEPDISEERYKEDLEANDMTPDEMSFEDWAESWAYDQTDLIVEDLEENILPGIENQMNFDMLFVTGDYHSNYGDFRPSGNGGKSLHGIDELKDYLFRWDGVEISNENGNIVLDAGDHDGSIEVGLFTFIDDKNKILEDLGYTENNEELGYYEGWQTPEDVFDHDILYDNFDWSTVQDHLDLLKPIKDTMSGLGESCETKINESSLKDSDSLENIANDIIKFYDTDMGNHFDEVKGNEEKIWNETMSILENPQDNKEIIEGFISDLTSTMEEMSEEEISKLFGINANKLIKELNDVLDGEYEPVEDVNPKDFKLNVVEENQIEDAKADSIEKGLYSEGDKKVCENCGKEPCECKSLEEAEETEVTNLQVIKEQGNIFMLEDETKKLIVGENYNKDENIIENAEIYENKEEADKDYLARCEITKDGKEFSTENEENQE